MLIVNADDFGLASHINKGIIEAIEKGAVNSVSLVAGGTALDEAVLYLKKNPKILVGIHFILISEKPVCDPMKIPTLVTAEGRFHPDYKSFIKQYIKGSINEQEIALELDAQIMVLKNLGINPVHADSHQHLHLLKKVTRPAILICDKNKISRIRIVNENITMTYAKQIVPLIAMKYFSNRLKKMANQLSITTSDFFFGFNTSMHVDQHIISLAKKRAENAVVELMVHPGFNTKDAGIYEKWGMDWDKERTVLIKGLEGFFYNR